MKLFKATTISFLIASSLPASVTEADPLNPAPWVGLSLSNTSCYGGEQGFGPFDYTLRSKRLSDLTVVEKHHFTPEVEQLIKGNTSTTPEGDLNYTLRAWPNHHKALLSIVRYQLNIKNKLMKDTLKPPPECYLQRAINFSPKDTGSYAIYGYYLNKMGHLEKAAEVYEKALAISPNNAKIEYEYSLLLIDMKQYDKALEYAKKAYAHGKPPKGLQTTLKKLGVWK